MQGSGFNAGSITSKVLYKAALPMAASFRTEADAVKLEYPQNICMDVCPADLKSFWQLIHCCVRAYILLSIHRLRATGWLRYVGHLIMISPVWL